MSASDLTRSPGSSEPSARDPSGHAGELMDSIYARQRHFYDATRKYFLLGRDRLIEELTPPHDGTVLEIGCGTGRNLIAAARAYPDVKLFGLDVSTKMLAKARANLRLAGLEERITLACGDAASFDPRELFGRSAFDRVFFSYSLSMIPAWRDALRQAHQVIAPDHGRLFVVDFGQQDGLPGWFRRLLFDWLTRFHVTPRAELEDAPAALRGGDGGLVFRRLYRGYASYAEVAR
jgi:S-adenosylmethionine-diacylgycerolhomoserine-N-methlytransferase